LFAAANPDKQIILRQPRGGAACCPKSAKILARTCHGHWKRRVHCRSRRKISDILRRGIPQREPSGWIDFWAVKPCGDPAADYARGQRYADEAIWHARATGQPVFVECVLMFMSMKLRHRDAGELEQGFVDRIVNAFPHAMDEVIVRLSRHRLKRLS